MTDPSADALTHSAAILVNRSPEDVYDLVADVTRTGEWSPICQACWWDEPGPAQVGKWFTGRNVTPERTWETRSQITVADRGRELAWEVGEGYVRWSYTFAPRDGGTELTEHWQLTPTGVDFFHQRYGAEADAQIAERTAAAHRGIPVTLAAIKDIAEKGVAEGA